MGNITNTLHMRCTTLGWLFVQQTAFFKIPIFFSIGVWMSFPKDWRCYSKVNCGFGISFLLVSPFVCLNFSWFGLGIITSEQLGPTLFACITNVNLSSIQTKPLKPTNKPNPSHLPPKNDPCWWIMMPIYGLHTVIP